MDPESKKLLEDNLRLSEDNNRILHAMRRSMLWGRVVHVIYWVIILGSAIGDYYFVQPYLYQVVNMYNSVSGTQQKINTSTNSIQDLLKKF